MIKSILGGKSKNLCDVAYLLTLPIDKKYEGHGYWRVLINAEPNTTYTFSRENASQISLVTDYLAISAYDDISHKYWLNHPAIPGLCHKSATLTTGSDGKLWILFNKTIYNNYWQKNLNPFGYIQLELGSTATEYVPHELTSYKSIMKVSEVCQLLDKSKYPATRTNNGITFTNNGDGSFTIDGTISRGLAVLTVAQISNLIVGHKYYSPSSKYNDAVYVETKIDRNNAATIWQSGIIHEWAENETTMHISLLVDSSRINTVENAILIPQLFDLTEMFGAGNEPKTVAEFKAKFPNDYYPYSPSCFVTSFDERMPCKTKNLFSSSTEVGIPSSTKFDKSEKRLMEDGKWYIGLAGSNYYSRKEILDYSIIENSVYIKWRSNGYGVAKCIYCEPNTTYSFTKKYSLIQGHSLGINVAFYTEDGTFISSKGETATPHFVFTTPENCKYVAICISGTKFPGDNFGAGCFSDLQLVKGSTATDYVPYGYV